MKISRKEARRITLALPLPQRSPRPFPLPHHLRVGLGGVRGRDVTDSGLESAPEYEFGSFEIIFKCDSGSGSFQADPLESAPIVDQLQMAYKIHIFCPNDTYFLIKTSLFWSQQDLINKKVKIIAFQ